MTTPHSTSPFRFELDAPVAKVNGDYHFIGIVKARYVNFKGHNRYVVESVGLEGWFDGMAHIFNEDQLQPIIRGNPIIGQPSSLDRAKAAVDRAMDTAESIMEAIK